MTRAAILPALRRTAADAERFARVVHAGQVDKAGEPYVGHLERVVRRAIELAGPHAYDPDRLAQIAWLHDILELDERPFGHVSTGDLLAEGFCRVVVDRAELLALNLRGLPYSAKIENIIATALNASDPALLLVKLADVEDNADPKRLTRLPDDVRARLERKYGPALKELRTAVRRWGEGDRQCMRRRR